MNLLAILFVTFVFACSAVGTCGQMKTTERSRTEPVAVGQAAPDFTLNDHNGQSVTLSTLGRPAVIVFYRGYWCPFCAKQLADLRGLLKASDDVAMFAISVDPAEKSRELAAKIEKDGKGKMNFRLLSDPESKTIDAYGVYDPSYAGKGFDGIPHASVFVIDGQGKVVWARIETDYKQRPTLDEIRAGIDLAKR
ncbi:MAG: redoxin domain-containing protein [Acidobacteria bacterium]|nr:redoxin domain-containing protein [Acidobacteriota bacterium]